MASRYALYVRRKNIAEQTFSFALSCPTLEMALEKKKENDRNLSNTETIIIESMNPNHRIDPYHIHFAAYRMGAA